MNKITKSPVCYSFRPPIHWSVALSEVDTTSRLLEAIFKDAEKRNLRIRISEEIKEIGKMVGDAIADYIEWRIASGKHLQYVINPNQVSDDTVSIGITDTQYGIRVEVGMMESCIFTGITDIRNISIINGPMIPVWTSAKPPMGADPYFGMCNGHQYLMDYYVYSIYKGQCLLYSHRTHTTPGLHYSEVINSAIQQCVSYAEYIATMDASVKNMDELAISLGADHPKSLKFYQERKLACEERKLSSQQHRIMDELRRKGMSGKEVLEIAAHYIEADILSVMNNNPGEASKLRASYSAETIQQVCEKYGMIYVVEGEG